MPAYTIRECSAEDQQIESIAQLTAEAVITELCDFEYPTVAEIRTFEEGLHRFGVQIKRFIALAPDGSLYGFAHQFRVPWVDRPAHHWGVIRVAPAYRRQGIGKALFQRLCESAKQQAGRSIVFEARLEATIGLEMALRYGLYELFRGLPFALNPAEFQWSRFQDSAKRAAEHGVEVIALPILQERDREWLSKLHTLYIPIVREVPIPEQPNLNATELADYIGQSKEACFVALINQEYVGLSFLFPSPKEAILYQKLTGVHADYRGKGVAMALKLATIEYAQQKGYRQIITWIENNNPAMLSVSDRLGFRQLPGGVAVLEKSL